MMVVSLVSWRRREAPGGWALFAFSASGLGWLLFDALALLAPTPASTVWIVKVTCLFGPLMGVSWLAFVLSYTERFTLTARLAIVADLAVFPGDGGVRFGHPPAERVD